MSGLLKRRFSNVVNTVQMKRLAKFVSKQKRFDYETEVIEMKDNKWDVTIMSPDLSIDHNGNARIKYVQS